MSDESPIKQEKVIEVLLRCDRCGFKIWEKTPVDMTDRFCPVCLSKGKGYKLRVAGAIWWSGKLENKSRFQRK